MDRLICQKVEYILFEGGVLYILYKFIYHNICHERLHR